MPLPHDSRALARVAIALVTLMLALASGCERSEANDEPGVQTGPVERPTDDIDWQTDHDAALAAAAQAGKPVLIDFTAEWCAPCIELDAVFADERVGEAIEARFVAIKMDGSESTAAIQPFMDRYGVEAFPTVVFIDSQGQVLDSPRLTDVVTPEQLLRTLASVQ